MISGAAPKNLMPVAPFSLMKRTQARASSGVVTGLSQNAPKAMYGSMRGAVMALAALLRACSTVQSMPLPLEGSRMVVMPWPIHSLKTYSAGVPWSVPPMWPCMSTSPGKMYIPSTSSSRSFGPASGRSWARIGTPG